MLRTSLLRAARPVSRSFSVSARSSKDLIQELYVKELKAYKPSPAAKESAAPVKAFSAPSAPSAPVLLDSAALAKELEAYDADVVSAPAPKAAAVSADSSDDALGADEYLHLVESDVKTADAHH